MTEEQPLKVKYDVKSTLKRSPLLITPQPLNTKQNVEFFLPTDKNLVPLDLIDDAHTLRPGDHLAVEMKEYPGHFHHGIYRGQGGRKNDVVHFYPRDGMPDSMFDVVEGSVSADTLGSFADGKTRAILIEHPDHNSEARRVQVLQRLENALLVSPPSYTIGAMSISDYLTNCELFAYKMWDDRYVLTNLPLRSATLNVPDVPGRYRKRNLLRGLPG